MHLIETRSMNMATCSLILLAALAALSSARVNAQFECTILGHQQQCVDNFLYNFDDGCTGSVFVGTPCCDCRTLLPGQCGVARCNVDGAIEQIRRLCAGAGGTLDEVGDGLCNAENNIEECLFDQGDCCECDCGFFPGGEQCGGNGFDCVNPSSACAVGEMCPGGIPGILSGDGTVCCDRECGQCGGSGCFQFPGGPGSCCIGGRQGILANADDCFTTGAAPCVIGEGGTCPGGIPGILSGDGTVCCDRECGQCGGSGCFQFPGGPGSCCIGGQRGILANADDCSTTGAAPCVIGEDETTCVDGIVGILSGDGTVCCDISCGSCGGSGCFQFPGGPGSCCIGGQRGILDNQDKCATTGSAPCVV